MKNKKFLLELQTAVKKYREEQKEKEEEQKRQQERRIRTEERKRAESKLKKFDAILLRRAASGRTFYSIESILSKNLISGDGSEIKHWPIAEQEMFKLLEEKGYEPKIYKRMEGDEPKAYSIEEMPYRILVSWEEN